MFKNPFSLEGRIRRTEYALSFLIYILCFFIAAGLLFVVHDMIIMYLVMLPLWWFMVTQSVKRCHDRGASGWYIFIPFYNFILLFAEGEEGGNKYGSNPKTGKDGFVRIEDLELACKQDVEVGLPVIEEIQEPKVLVNHAYKSDLGELIIEQELSQPNIGERAFMDGKPAHSDKYKVGFMNYIHIENGRIKQFSML